MKEALKKIGLTEGETKVYLALLDLGSSSIGAIIKKSGISGSKTYEVLDRLMKKGLVNEITKNNVRYFETASPKRILDYLDEKKQEIEIEKQNINKIIPELIAKQKGTKKAEAKIFLGFEGAKTVYEDAVQNLKKGDEILGWGLTEQPESWEIYFNKREKVRDDRGVIHKSIINRKYKSLYNVRKKFKNTFIRFFPEELEMPTDVQIWRDKVALFITTKENPITILIENKAVADSFRASFYILWEYADNKTRLYHGKQGPIIALKEVQETARKGIEVVGYGTDEDDYLKYFPAQLKEYTDEAKKLKWKERLLFAKGFKSPNTNAKIRHLPREFITPVRTMIYGNKVAIVDFTKPMTTIIINKKEVAKSYLEHFNLLWKIAKPK